MHDIELHFAVKEKRHKQENNKDFFRTQKDVGMKKSTTGPQFKPTRKSLFTG